MQKKYLLTVVSSDLNIANSVFKRIDKSNQITFKQSHLDWKTFQNSTPKQKHQILMLDITSPDIPVSDLKDQIKTYAEQTALIILATPNQEQICLELINEGVEDYFFLDEIKQFSFSRMFLNAIRRQKARKKHQKTSISSQIQAKLISFLENGLLGTVVHDKMGKVWYTNPTATEILGLSEEQMLSTPFLYQQKGDNESAYVITTPKGTEQHISVRTVDMEWEGRKGFLTTIYDTTEVHVAKSEKNHLTQQLYRAQKMEAIGMLAGGIAHDFNNIMSITMMASSNASRVVTDSKLLRDLQIIQEAAERGTSITRQLLAFSRSNEITKIPVNVSDVVKQLYKMLSHSLPKEIDLNVDYSENDGHVLADSGQLYQVLLNMAVNAKDAMPNGGTLNIVVHKSDPGNLPEEVRVTIQDTGTGIPLDIQEHIFEPFFSTKSIDKGTGLGLSMAKQIIDAHEGQIRLKSEPEKGTSFTVALPKIVSKKKAVTQAQQEIHIGNQERILLVEDESTLRNILHKALNEFGYLVHEAENGQEAIKVFEKHKHQIDLVITDLGMPKMNGRELHKHIKMANPDMKVIIATGYLEQELKDQLIKAGVSEFINKPFNIKSILETIHNVLSENKYSETA
jgi:signal transduction histidine kinase/ActR/RegA family two-component response regulator